jgi:hypothetical protein
MQVALGIKARTGRAILVAVGTEAAAPQCLERLEMKLLPDGAFAPYHAAEGLPLQEAHIVVQRAIAEARALARSSIASIVKRLQLTGHTVQRCGVLEGRGMPSWSTEDILALHVRMHKAEGELFRQVVADGARACKLEVVSLPSDTPVEAAARALELTRPKLNTLIIALGKQVGPPWGKHQKEAAAAALAALGS